MRLDFTHYKKRFTLYICSTFKNGISRPKAQRSEQRQHKGADVPLRTQTFPPSLNFLFLEKMPLLLYPERSFAVPPDCISQKTQPQFSADTMKCTPKKRNIEQYEHIDNDRLNNPESGIAFSAVDQEKKKYAHDPHLDPQLQWAGKAERTSFEIPTVSLHVHERVDPKRIIDEVTKEDTGPKQQSLFDLGKKPMLEAVKFYKHRQGWSNRLIAGDSLLVMNSLLEKESMAGKVQMVYFDPPYGIKYGSNFQPFVNQRNVTDGKDADLTAEPETIKAFRDTWELGIHSYLTYLRDRLLLAKELLHESGSIFVQISDENVHRVRCLLDEVFGAENFVSIISFSKAAGGLQAANRMSTVLDYLIWYAKDSSGKVKYNSLFEQKSSAVDAGFTQLMLSDGTIRSMTAEEKNSSSFPSGAKQFMSVLMTKPGPGAKFTVEYQGKKYTSGKRWWGTTPEGIENIIKANRIVATPTAIRFISYFNDFPYRALTNLWSGLGGASSPVYVVQTNQEIVKRCLLMTTDPGDLVLDITCGSGTTAYVAEQWGRRWITCDTSRVAVTLAKQRLMTAVFDYYKLADPQEGVSGGFQYKTVPHITLKSIANNEPPAEEILYDQPYEDKSKVRVSGPFTVEAVPRPYAESAKSLEEIERENQGSGESVTRSGETLRQAMWRDELLKTGIRAKDGSKIEFSRVEPLSGTRYIQCKAETKEEKPKKIFIVFGPEYAPLDYKMFEDAWNEARQFHPDMQLFCAFQFDEEAARHIDEFEPRHARMQLLRVQMNADLFTDDLKKKRASNESFWLIGQPDIAVKQIAEGDDKGRYQVEVQGFDYYNPKTGNVESGSKGSIAVWQLDTDYDGRSLFPNQVFFPMAGGEDGWGKLAKNLKAEIDQEKIEYFGGTVSLPFAKGQHSKIAVKIIDDRGIESLRVINL